MTETILQIASLNIAALSAAVSVYFSVRARRETKIQTQMQSIGLLRSYYSDLQTWADAVVEVITEAIFLCDYDPAKMHDGELFLRWVKSKQSISTLIDQGRFFLPNEKPDAHGQQKPAAYRGYRPRALNCLARIYKLLEEFNYRSQGSNRMLRSKLWDARKEFVSHLQEILNPQERELQIQIMLTSMRQK